MLLSHKTSIKISHFYFWNITMADLAFVIPRKIRTDLPISFIQNIVIFQLPIT